MLNDNNKLAVMLNRLSFCDETIKAYNVQYLSSTALCAIVAAVTGIINTNIAVGWKNLLYILPTVYLSFLYNIVKYTNEQLQLGAYKEELEKQIFKIIDMEYLCWEQRVSRGFKYTFFKGVAVAFFQFPVFVFLMFYFFTQFCSSIVHFD